MFRWIDNLLWWLAPGWKLKREAARQRREILNEIRRLKAASRDRIYGKFTGTEDRPNSDISDLRLVRYRANYLYNNDPFVRGAIDTLLNRAIGAGSIVQARTRDEQFNDRAEHLFASWSYSADYYRQYHFGDIQRLALLKLFLDGGIFFHKLVDPNNDTVPFSLEVLEYSRLAPTGTPQKGNVVFHGIELSKEGRVVAYHFYKNPVDVPTTSYEIVRVPAEEIIHFSPFRRPHQLLGIPLIAPAVPYAYHLAEILEAELINAKVSASFGVVIKKTTPYGDVSALQTNEQGQREIEIAPGMVEFLEPGEDIEVIDPKRPGSTFDEFVKIILRGIGKSFGLSYEQISGDKSEVNYSSARHSELELRDYLTPIRKALERYFLKPVYQEFVKWAVSLGQLNVQGGIKDWKNWTAHRWIHKGYEWVDPQKEAKAKELELRLGLTTLADEAASKGKDWKELIDQRAKEIEYLRSKGILDITQMVRPENVEAADLLSQLLEESNGNQA